MKTPPRECRGALLEDPLEEEMVRWDKELSDELWMQVLWFVAPLELLQCVVNVNRRLRGLLRTQHYWVFHLESLRQSPRCEWLPSDQVTENYQEVYQEEFIRDSLNTHQLQRLCLYWVANRKHESIPAGLKHGSRLVSQIRAETIRNRHYRTGGSRRRRVCLASSTEHASELLENVLEGRGTATADEIFQNLGILAAAFPHHRPFQWWSSKPSPTQESHETLLFATNCPLAVLSNLKLRPLLDPFTRGQVYSWRTAVIQAYRLPLSKLDPQPENPHAGFPCCIAMRTTTTPPHQPPTSSSSEMFTFQDAREEEEADEDDVEEDAEEWTRQHEAMTLQEVLRGETPVYSSPELPYHLPSAPCTHQRQVPWQRLVFPPTTLANVVTITLYGKDSRQYPHSGFYACVEKVQLEGIPLLENVSLKYTQGMW